MSDRLEALWYATTSRPTGRRPLPRRLDLLGSRLPQPSRISFDVMISKEANSAASFQNALAKPSYIVFRLGRRFKPRYPCMTIVDTYGCISNMAALLLIVAVVASGYYMYGTLTKYVKAT